MLNLTRVTPEPAVTVEVSETGVSVITLGLQGPPGVAATTVTGYPTTAALGGHRVVALDATGAVVLASNLNLSQAESVLGITTGATEAGSFPTIQRSGEIVEPSWNWTLGQPIFLGTGGLLTQTPPTLGFLLHVAFPISPTRAFIDIKQAFIL